MSDGEEETRASVLKDRLIRTLPFHMTAYGVVATLAAMIQIFAPVSFSLLKPMLFWAMLLIPHYLYVRAVNIDQEWADERSSTITYNATDLSHIDDIKQRFEEKERQFTDVEDQDDAVQEKNGKQSDTS